MKCEEAEVQYSKNKERILRKRHNVGVILIAVKLLVILLKFVKILNQPEKNRKQVVREGEIERGAAFERTNILTPVKIFYKQKQITAKQSGVT